MPRPEVLKNLDGFGPDSDLIGSLRDRVKEMDKEGVFDEYLEGARPAEQRVRMRNLEPVELIPTEEYRYKFGGIKYVLREPVLGQQTQLTELLRGINLSVGKNKKIPADMKALERMAIDALKKIPVNKVLEILGSKAPQFYAIILTPEDTPMEHKKLEDVEKHIKNNMPMSLQLRVIRDFFALGGETVRAAILLAQDAGGNGSRHQS